jgi:hypothetical protein
VRDEKVIKSWLENMKGGYHAEDLDVDGRVILQWFLGNIMGRCGLDSSGSG